MRHRLRMRSGFKELLTACLVAVVAGMPIAACADDDNDHDLARDLYERGEIRSLSEILRAVGRRVRGDVVAVDLIRLGDHWVYRFQVVAGDGRRTTVDIDAGSIGASEGSTIGRTTTERDRSEGD